MVTRARDGGTWRIGTDADVAWIAEGTASGRTITTAIPPVFEAYATVVVAYGEERVKHDRAVLALLAGQSPDQRWWLGYLDTGVDDIVFPDATESDFALRMALRAGRGGTGTGSGLASA